MITLRIFFRVITIFAASVIVFSATKPVLAQSYCDELRQAQKELRKIERNVVQRTEDVIRRLLAIRSRSRSGTVEEPMVKLEEAGLEMELVTIRLSLTVATERLKSLALLAVLNDEQCTTSIPAPDRAGGDHSNALAHYILRRIKPPEVRLVTIQE